MQGDKRIDKLMLPVLNAINRHVKDRDAKTDIYNRAYEAVMISTVVKTSTTGVKTPESIENTNPDYYKQELARRDEKIEELQFQLDSLCPCGSNPQDEHYLLVDEMCPIHGHPNREIARRDEIITRLKEVLPTLKISHNYCEDCWYSCPKHEDGCCNEAEGEDCNCGADEHNSKIDALMKELE